MSDNHESAFVTSLIGERIAGRYVVERVLRSGGMGVVAVGRYPELEQEVAIKFVKPEYASNPTTCARFLREARLAARVKSPHFVRVFDFGRVEPGVPYMVMELLTGRDLADELKAEGRLPVATAVDYVLQASVALAEVHGLGVVHRDLKPSNLFLAEAGGTRMLKVLDFGVSKENVAEALTSTGMAVGTPHYMSPEQVRESKTVDARSDIWSLGVILYELVTDALPFGDDGVPMGELYGMILHTDPVPPRTPAPDLSVDLENVILKCLKRDPAGRYANVGELAEALRPFAAATDRIDAVRSILASVKPIERIDSDGSLPAGRKSPARNDEPAKAASSPGGGGGALLSSPRAEASTRALGPGGRRETAMTATRPSEVPEILRAPSRRPFPIARVGLIAFAIGIVIAIFALRRSTSAPPTTAASTAPPAPSTIATAAAPAPAPAPPTSASAAATPTPAPTPTPTPSASATIPPARHRASPPRGAAPSPSAQPPDLLDDRK